MFCSGDQWMGLEEPVELLIRVLGEKQFTGGGTVCRGKSAVGVSESGSGVSGFQIDQFAQIEGRQTDLKSKFIAQLIDDYGALGK